MPDRYGGRSRETRPDIGASDAISDTHRSSANQSFVKFEPGYCQKPFNVRVSWASGFVLARPADFLLMATGMAGVRSYFCLA